MPVFINNVDDYLGPSQACVNPLFAPEKPTPTQQPASSSDVNLAKNGTADDSTDGVNASSAGVINSNSSRKVVQNRRRIRPRRAPRINNSKRGG